MFFFPYRIDLDLRYIPYLTIAVCLLCIVIFLAQLRSNFHYEDATSNFCGSLDRVTILVLRGVGHSTEGNPCVSVFGDIRKADNADLKIHEMSLASMNLNFYEDRNDEIVFIEGTLKSAFLQYQMMVPQDLTTNFAYEPLNMRVWTMLTSTFSHGSWDHLIFNLIFFYAFAAAIEVILGSRAFCEIIVLMAVTTSLAYSYSVADDLTAPPTVGLSGVVMGMLALLAVLMPRARICCFAWFIVFFKVFRIPAIFLALWYVGWDLLAYNSEEDTNVNYMAHISGAVTGVVVGLCLWMFGRDLLTRIDKAG